MDKEQARLTEASNSPAAQSRRRKGECLPEKRGWAYLAFNFQFPSLTGDRELATTSHRAGRCCHLQVPVPGPHRIPPAGSPRRVDGPETHSCTVPATLTLQPIPYPSFIISIAQRVIYAQKPMPSTHTHTNKNRHLAL